MSGLKKLTNWGGGGGGWGCKKRKFLKGMSIMSAKNCSDEFDFFAKNTIRCWNLFFDPLEHICKKIKFSKILPDFQKFFQKISYYENIWFL